MLNKNAKKWVKALRSGKYKQGIGQLRSGEKFCCLGVACDLAVKAGVIKSFVGSRAGLTKTVRKWLNLNESEGDYEGGMGALSADNDDGKNFLTIANIIESEPKGLFVE